MQANETLSGSRWFPSGADAEPQAVDIGVLSPSTSEANPWTGHARASAQNDPSRLVTPPSRGRPTNQRMISAFANPWSRTAATPTDANAPLADMFRAQNESSASITASVEPPTSSIVATPTVLQQYFYAARA